MELSPEEKAQILETPRPTLKSLRKAAGLKQAEVSDAIGATPIHAWEKPGRGTTAMTLTEQQLIDYAKALKADPAVFVEAMPPFVTIKEISKETLLAILERENDGSDES